MKTPAFSYWEETVFFGDVDFVIVGAGLTGLWTALHLKKKAPQARVVILEKAMIPTGASTRNAGFACFGSMTELLADLRTMGEEDTWQLVQDRWEGLQFLRKHVTDREMDFQAFGGYEVFLEEDESAFVACIEHLDDFNQRLASITGIKNVFAPVSVRDFPFGKVKYVLSNRAEAQLNPARLVRSLMRQVRRMGVEIFAGAAVEGWEDGAEHVEVHLPGSRRIKSGHLIIATNGFARRLMPELDMRPARNLVMVTSPVKQLRWKGIYHYDEGYIYFRNVGDRVLLGGARNLDPKTEETDRFGINTRIEAHLKKWLEEVILPGARYEIEYRWSGIMGMGDAKRPIVKKLSPHVTLAVRLGGMGVALAGKVGAEAAGLCS